MIFHRNNPVLKMDFMQPETYKQRGEQVATLHLLPESKKTPKHRAWGYSQSTSKLKCVGSPCRIIYTVFGSPPVSLLKLIDYI